MKKIKKALGILLAVYLFLFALANTFSAPDERRALIELEEIADGGYVIDFGKA